MLGEAAPRKTDPVILPVMRGVEGAVLFVVSPGLPAAPRGSQLLCGLSVDPLSRHLFLNSASQQELMSFLGYFR
ncbi:hypothetical protein BS78_05G264300 [Paspalum vaginatum]|nr:hypothetical protein BS78_05G264300 [Paspalum vaginatum]KAJ1277052.1 hypothetical protein BS78_05G264300 [Paspalum vaginatum]